MQASSLFLHFKPFADTNRHGVCSSRFMLHRSCVERPRGPAAAMPTTGIGTPAPLTARQGRDNQRYSADGERLVAGCIPVRIDTSKSGPASAQVLLISAHGGKGMVFPKGGWETDETVEAAAKRETIEEAGVRGTLEESMLGVFPYASAKASRLALSNHPRGIAHIFVMHVAEELDKWPEADKRTRSWLSVEDASRQCRHEWMREVLRAWAKREGWTNLDLQTPDNCDLHKQPVDVISACELQEQGIPQH